MYNHVSLKVKDAKKSRTFYERALKPLGYKVIDESQGGAGFGAEDETTLWISEGGAHAPSVHVAFTVAERKQVDAFHAAATGAGGRDNGKPGIRDNYGPNYYAAFVHDPDGNNIEAVCLKPASGAKR